MNFRVLVAALLLSLLLIGPAHALSVLYAYPAAPPTVVAAGDTVYDTPCIGSAAACGNGMQNLGAITGSTLTSITFYVTGSLSGSPTIDFGVWNSAGTVETSDFGSVTFSTASCVSNPPVAGSSLCAVTKAGSATINANDVVAITLVSLGGAGNVNTVKHNASTLNMRGWDGGPDLGTTSVYASFSGTPGGFPSDLQWAKGVAAIIMIGAVLTWGWKDGGKKDGVIPFAIMIVLLGGFLVVLGAI